MLVWHVIAFHRANITFFGTQLENPDYDGKVHNFSGFFKIYVMKISHMTHRWSNLLCFIYILTHTHLFGDVAVLINVVKVKGPVELFCDRTPEQHWQADDEVLKADRTVSVDVKCIEQEVSVGGGICGQKEWGSLIEC